MKITPSSCVLVAEIVTISLFHLVKIKQAEKHPSDTAFNRVTQAAHLQKPVSENKNGFEYLLVRMTR